MPLFMPLSLFCSRLDLLQCGAEVWCHIAVNKLQMLKIWDFLTKMKKIPKYDIILAETAARPCVKALLSP